MKRGSPGNKSLDNKSPHNKNDKASGISTNTIISEATIRSGVDVLHGFAPRCWAILGQKIQIRDFEPVEIQYGYAEDIRVGDVVEDVSKKVIGHVKKMVTPLIAEAEKAKKQFKNKKEN